MTSFKATKNTEDHMAKIRWDRNRLLYLTDWVFGSEANFSEEEKARVRAYRNALKSVTNVTNDVWRIPDHSLFNLPTGVAKYLRAMIDGNPDQRR